MQEVLVTDRRRPDTPAGGGGGGGNGGVDIIRLVGTGHPWPSLL